MGTGQTLGSLQKNTDVSAEKGGEKQLGHLHLGQILACTSRPAVSQRISKC